MSDVVIDLQDGFDGQPVSISVNGAKVFQKDNVTTMKLTGYAESVSVPLTDESLPVKISVECGELMPACEIQLDSLRERFLGISVDEGKVKYITSARPFGYG